jgi:VWFA-related protein
MPRPSRRNRLRDSVLVGVACASVIGSFAATGRSVGAAAPTQDASSRERGIYAIVVDRNGTPVTDLTSRDFVVREDGVAREVLMVEPATDPITLALLVDNSQAATAVIPDVRRALRTFVGTMGGHNPMSVVTFGDRPTTVQDYTLVVPQLVRSVERIFPLPGSGACLLQAVREVSAGFGRRDVDRGVILVITTEGPELSDLDEEQVLPALRRSGAALESIVFNTPRSPDPRRDGFRFRAALLDRGPRDTGGRRVDLSTSMALDGALQKLALQLTSAYRITYSRPDALIPPEKIEIAVRRPGLDARGTPIRSRRG